MTGQVKKNKEITRRSFLKTAGIALGVGAAACGGVSYFGLKTPSTVEFPEIACGAGGEKRVLVAYASKCGATAAAAEYIGRQLCERGCQVDTRRARNVADIGAYQAVILGGAVYMGGLLGEASSFAAKFQADLADTPTALFNMGLTMKEDSPGNLREALAYLDPLREYVEPLAVGAFAGRIDLDTLPPLYRAFAQADTEGILAEGDYRDWDVLRDWVDALPVDFLPV